MATNRIDILDPALLRPGRIDRKIEFPNPNDKSRLDILKIHSRKMNLTRGINLQKIAELMSGSSGAELKGCCTEAGMQAAMLSTVSCMLHLVPRNVHHTSSRSVPCDFDDLAGVSRTAAFRQGLFRLRQALDTDCALLLPATRNFRFRTFVQVQSWEQLASTLFLP